MACGSKVEKLSVKQCGEAGDAADLAERAVVEEQRDSLAAGELAAAFLAGDAGIIQVVESIDCQLAAPCDVSHDEIPALRVW